MSMLGRINTTFGTYQADLFESGLVAQIGPNSFAVWAAIKAHADFQTGIAWPSVRRLMALTGLASSTVQKCLTTLEDAHLLRSDVRNKRRYYVARERLDVSLGQRVLCTVVVDYVPASMRDRLAAVRSAIDGGDPSGLVDVDIIPGEGFTWDEKARVLRAKMPARDVPAPPSVPLGELGERMNKRVKLLKK